MQSVMYSSLSRASRSVVARATVGARAASHHAAAGAHPRVTGLMAFSRGNASALPIHRSFSAVSDSLLDMLKREYDEEQENKTTVMPDDLKDLYKTIQKNDWKIVDEGAYTRLFSTSGAKKVQILFHCQDTVEDAVEEETFEEDEEEEFPEEDVPGFRFSVAVTKAGKSMVFQCYTKYGETNIETVAVTKLDVADLDKGVPPGEYQGPEFVELAEDLQEAFKEYLLEEIGINEDMNAFISMYADFKEQGHYVDFLEDAQTLLK